MNKYNFIIEHAISYAINKGCTIKNYKKNIRSYIENAFKNTTVAKDDINVIIKKSYLQAEKIFNF